MSEKPSETSRILNDIRDYVRISAATSSRPVAKTAIDTWEKAEVYSRLDGLTSQPKISEAAKVPQRTISDWLALLVQAGLATEPNEFYSCHRALFSLRELGISQAQMNRKRQHSQYQGVLSGSPTQPAQGDSTKETQSSI